MTILCMVAYGFNKLHVLVETNNSISEFVPQKESRQQEFMTYLVHSERCRDIICMGQKEFIQLCQQIRGMGIVRDTF